MGVRAVLEGLVCKGIRLSRCKETLLILHEGAVARSCRPAMSQGLAILYHPLSFYDIDITGLPESRAVCQNASTTW